MSDNFKIPVNSADDALAFCRSLRKAVQKTEFADVEFGEVEISVIVPAYNESETIEELIAQVTSQLKEVASSYELIVVDDGSEDNTAQLVEAACGDNKNLTLIRLSRNFGQQQAYCAGLEYARGRAVVMMDADLQDSPQAIPRLVQEWRSGVQVVYAVRVRRKESFVMRVFYSLYYKILHAVARINIPVDAGDFCIIDRQLVDILLSFPERNRFIRGLRSWVGFKQIGIEVERGERKAGKSKYSAGQLLQLALDGIFSFSDLPLRLISLCGVGVSLLAGCLSVFYVIRKVIFGLTPAGFTTLTVAVCFFAGIQLLTIGIVGAYVGRIFTEVKRRPVYLVKEVIGRKFRDTK